MTTPDCTYESCDRAQYAKGYCSAHYWNLSRGRPLRPIQTQKARTDGRTLLERLLDRVAVAPSGCWEWQAHLNDSGYGRVWNGSKVTLAHRLAYELHIGPIPNGLQLDHLCRNRACVNPEHLEPVDARTNVLRSASRGAIAVATNRCFRGHEFTPENTYTSKSGDRHCRECRRIWNREARRDGRRK